jgi:hypothetical protein
MTRVTLVGAFAAALAVALVQFSDGGRHFRLLGFHDTNGDFGGVDSYYGDRR